MESDMNWIDLRSDTVTEPTDAMRTAMAEAEVGDDVYGEDPTINRLEQLSAGMLGKEAGLFVPSGTMGNLAAVLTHCGRGDEMLLGSRSHTFLYEAGGAAALAGVHPYTLPNLDDGTIPLDEIRSGIRPDNIHFPSTRLLILENTHNVCGGTPLRSDYIERAAALVHEHGIKLHIDGARIFNAAAALGKPASKLAVSADSITFCLSKGLAAPVGSVLCGAREFIDRARRNRKMLGGGMRQAGILAAAGIVALEQMVERLAEDHERTFRLGEELAEIPGIELYQGLPATNMLYIRINHGKINTTRVIEMAAERRIRLGARSDTDMRLVLHYQIDDNGVERVAGLFRDLLS